MRRQIITLHGGDTFDTYEQYLSFLRNWQMDFERMQARKKDWKATLGESLHRFFKGVTAIVIAHRLTTIREMDRIILIESGRIAESGTFSELYRKKGTFRKLWERQRLEEAIGER